MWLSPRKGWTNSTGYQVYEWAALSRGWAVLWGLRLRPLLRVATEPAFCPTHKLQVRSKVCKRVTQLSELPIFRRHLPTPVCSGDQLWLMTARPPLPCPHRPAPFWGLRLLYYSIFRCGKCHV